MQNTDKIYSLNATVSSWTRIQEELASNVDYTDNNDWGQFFTSTGFHAERDLFVAGVDISFSTTENLSIGTIVVVKLRRDARQQLVYSHSRQVSVEYPYVPSFLGFREAPIVSALIKQLPRQVRCRLDCLLVDGNGVLHPRKAGLACQVGVEENIPCIGVSKNLLCVDGLSEKAIRECTASSHLSEIDVIGTSGFLWGKAIMTGNAQRKPIFVSVGHRVSLVTSARLVAALCEFRIPSPIRLADMHSRAYLRGECNDLYLAEEFV